MDQCGCGDLFVQSVLGRWHAQATPDLGSVQIEWQDEIPIPLDDFLQPGFQALRLWPIATMTRQGCWLSTPRRSSPTVTTDR